MPGNDRPHGARRRPGSKKGPQVGTGGHRRKALEGRGPTPVSYTHLTLPTKA